MGNASNSSFTGFNNTSMFGGSYSNSSFYINSSNLFLNINLLGTFGNTGFIANYISNGTLTLNGTKISGGYISINSADNIGVILGY